MYTIITTSNNHPRTINTPANGRTYYDACTAATVAELIARCAELTAAGETISEIFSTANRFFFTQRDGRACVYGGNHFYFADGSKVYACR